MLVTVLIAALVIETVVMIVVLTRTSQALRNGSRLVREVRMSIADLRENDNG